VGSEGIKVSASRRSGWPLRGGWAKTVLVGALIVAIAVVIIGLGLTGRLADLNHANLPFHPYPPTGYAYNPFNPGNKDDLIKIADANAVKADLVSDGEMQLRALEIGDASLLDRSTTGNFLRKLQQRLTDDAASGIYEREQNHIDSVVVGKLADPASVGVTWCVEERATGTTSVVSRKDGRVISTNSFRSVSKFWLIQVGDHYLVTDAQISAAPGA
jgi:hypothetical protein